MTNDKLKMTNVCMPHLRSAIYYINNIAKRFIHLTFVIGHLTLLCFPVLADGQAGLDIAALSAGVGARPLGMGSAFTAVADNADAPYWNPAGLAYVTSSEITTMQTRLSTDSDHYYLSYVQPVLGGTMGVSWIQIGTGSLVNTSSEVDNNNEVVDLGNFSCFSTAYLLSYGKKLNDHISFGLTGTYLTSDMTTITSGQSYGYSVSPALLLKMKIKDGDLSIGAKIDDLLNQQAWGTGTLEQAPPKFRLGLAYAKSNPGLFAIDLCQTLRSGYNATVNLGYEWAKDALSLRVGYKDSGFTAGAGFIAGIARVDYAYVVQQELSRNNVHRISLSGIW